MDVRTHGLPRSLGSTARLPFVGRAAELDAIRTLMPGAEGGRLVLLAGEPGVGKSRLVRELTGGTEMDEALVLHGSCDAAVRAAYGPFADILDGLIRAVDATELQAALGMGGGELTRLIPDLPARAGELAAPAAADPDTERHRLHTAVAELLTNAARDRTVVLVLEDLHWADAPTLLLLRHLARSVARARLLILATLRDTQADRSEEIAATLADLRRSDDVVRMRIEGLSRDDIADLVRHVTGSEGELGELAAAIHDLTDGNAFLVCELWRALVETGTVEVVGSQIRTTRPLTELATPESVREVVSQRLSRLAPKTIDLLELAAAAGPEFALEPVRRAAGLAEPELLVALDEAVASGMVEELPSQGVGCRFTHEIVRRALYDRLSHIRRAELHLRVGEALESDGAARDRVLADLAHHFGLAAPFGGAERAVDYNVRAARAASAALAFDEAAMRLRTAIEIGIESAPERAGTLLELGTASHRAGRASDALSAFVAAAAIGRELGSAELLARAAIGYEEACWRPGITNGEAIGLLEEALGASDAAGDELRIRLQAGLARALSFHGQHEPAAVVRGDAIASARRLGDGDVLAKVLVRSYWARGTTPLEEILEMLTEGRDLAAERGDAETYTEALSWRVPTFVALGDLESARAEVEVLRDLAEGTAQPFMGHVAAHYGSALALCDGRLADAEAMAERSHDLAALLTGRDASGVYGIQMFSIRREQGRLAELASAVGVLAGDAAREGPWRPGLVAVLAELGMEREARRELSKLVSEGIDGFRESLWLATLAYLADACAALGDEEMAAIAYPELEPLAGSNVMIGHGVACYGAADRYLGMLAATLGEVELAEGHFERALESNRAMGAPTWVAHTAYQYARLLLSRGRPGRARAEALVGEAASLAERIGMEALLGRIRSLGVAAAPGGGLPAGLSGREAQILDLVAKGLSNREIGAELTISEHTAANHVRSILRKTDCANRTEAASYAHRHGLASA
ncbi:MAG: AAA family ATPase [Thermoleophilaceae bacterium]